MKIVLLPTPLAEGWESMNHYWISLQQQFFDSKEVVSALGQAHLGGAAKGRFARLLARVVVYPLKLRRFQSAEVFHILDHSYADLIRFVSEKARVLVTVHDLIPLTDESLLDASQRERFLKRVSFLRKADQLVCVSQFTASEVGRILDIPSEKMRVVPMGVDKEYLNVKGDESPVFNVPSGRKPLLVVGSSIPRKNLSILPEILRQLPEDEYAVVKVGQKFPEDLAHQIREILGRDGLLEVGFVDADKLPLFYAQSFALIFPSLLEGFGLPVLEAMAAGCPVVCSDRASLPEVGGDCVIYFNPEEATGGAQGLVKLAKDESFRKDLVQRARVRAATMTWAHHADSLKNIYRDLMN